LKDNCGAGRGYLLSSPTSALCLAQYSHIQFREANVPRSEVERGHNRRVIIGARALQTRNNGLWGGKTTAAAAEHTGAVCLGSGDSGDIDAGLGRR